MLIADYIKLASTSLRFNHLRTSLTALGIAVGVAAVVLLTALGGGMQDYILKQFTQFGAHLIAIAPGKANTIGLSGAVISNVRPLTAEDAQDLLKINGVETAVPLIQGNALIESGNRSRWTFVFGVNHQTPQTWQFKVAQGQFLPKESLDQARSFVVIGARIKQELFPSINPLGKFIRIGQERYRVIGVMEEKGQILGFDMDDAVYIPVKRAMSSFNRDSLMEIDILYSSNKNEKLLVDKIKQRLIKRHGSEDFTITSQSDMINTLGSILDILTAVVAGLGGISLTVGGVGIFTIMSIAVSERIKEIGLLRALGASKHQVTWLFLLESAVLAGLGGLSGLLFALAVIWILYFSVPALPIAIAWDYVLLAELVAIVTGIIAGLVPAKLAAKLAPVDALRSE